MGKVSGSSYWVLVALAGGVRHGYALIEEVGLLSRGTTTLKVATLYPTLERLRGEGLIESAGEEVVTGRRRRYFRLTAAGADALGAEAARLAADADQAKMRLAQRGWSEPFGRGELA